MYTFGCHVLRNASMRRCSLCMQPAVLEHLLVLFTIPPSVAFAARPGIILDASGAERQLLGAVSTDWPTHLFACQRRGLFRVQPAFISARV